MKYTITHIAEWVLLAILALLCIYTAYKAYQVKHNVEYITNTVTVTDTITQLEHDTLYLSRNDTVKLPVIYTETDTLLKTDSILVQVPILSYHFDTTINKPTHTTHLEADIEGFNVKVAQLTATTEIMPQMPKKEPRWYQNIVPAVGIGIGTGGVGAFVGVGYKIF